MRPAAPALILLSTCRLVDCLHHGRLVEQDDARLAVLRVSRVVEVAEVDVCHSLVRFMHDTDADIAVLLVLPVEGVTDHIVAGLGVEAGHTEDLVTATVHATAASTAAESAGRAERTAAGGRTSPVSHTHCTVRHGKLLGWHVTCHGICL